MSYTTRSRNFILVANSELVSFLPHTEKGRSPAVGAFG